MQEVKGEMRADVEQMLYFIALALIIRTHCPIQLFISGHFPSRDRDRNKRAKPIANIWPIYIIRSNEPSLEATAAAVAALLLLFSSLDAEQLLLFLSRVRSKNRIVSYRIESNLLTTRRDNEKINRNQKCRLLRFHAIQSLES